MFLMLYVAVNAVSSPPYLSKCMFQYVINTVQKLQGTLTDRGILSQFCITGSTWIGGSWAHGHIQTASPWGEYTG